jgi:RNA polymerase sigma-70 factor (family 1)
MRKDGDLILWQSFKRGEWDAYTRLYDAYFSTLNNYGHKFTRDKELIEDAVHDLFVRLWTTKGRLSDPVSVRNYLFKSLRNILLRKMKSEEKFTDIDGQEYPLSFSISYGSETVKRMEDRELQEKIKSFIETLPPRQQEIIYLRFYEGLSYEEIADVMSISVKSAYKLLYKALENLQDTFGTSSLSVLLGFKIFSNFFLP